MAKKGVIRIKKKRKMKKWNNFANHLIAKGIRNDIISLVFVNNKNNKNIQNKKRNVAGVMLQSQISKKNKKVVKVNNIVNHLHADNIRKEIRFFLGERSLNVYAKNNSNVKFSLGASKRSGDCSAVVSNINSQVKSGSTRNHPGTRIASSKRMGCITYAWSSLCAENLDNRFDGNCVTKTNECSNEMVTKCNAMVKPTNVNIDRCDRLFLGNGYNNSHRDKGLRGLTSNDVDSMTSSPCKRYDYDRRYYQKHHSDRRHSNEYHSDRRHSDEYHSDRRYSNEYHSDRRYSDEYHSDRRHSIEYHSDRRHSIEYHSDRRYSIEYHSDRRYSIEFHSDRRYSIEFHSDRRHSIEYHSDRRHSDEYHSDRRHSNEYHSDRRHSDEYHSDRRHSNEYHSDRRHSDEYNSDRRHSNEYHSDRRHSDEYHSDRRHSDEYHSDRRHSDEYHSDRRHSNKYHSDRRHSNKYHSDRRHSDEYHSDRRHSDKHHLDRNYYVSTSPKRSLKNLETSPLPAETICDRRKDFQLKCKYEPYKTSLSNKYTRENSSKVFYKV